MTTLQLSMLPLEPLTLLPQDSLVRTFQVPIPTGEGWKVNDQDCSLRSSDCFAQFSPDSSCLKTSQISLSGDLSKYCGSFPSAGLMLNGRLFHLPQWERSIFVRGFSYLPTPKAQERPGVATCKKGQTQHLSAAVLSGNKTHTLNPRFVEWMMGVPENWTDTD